MRRVLPLLAALLTASTASGQSNPTLSDLWQRGMAAYMSRHDYAAARAIFDSIVAYDSTRMAAGDTNAVHFYGDPFMMRAMARRHLGDAAGADRDLQAMFALHPQQNRDFLIGSMRHMDADLAGAIAAYDRAIQANPKDGMAVSARARALMQLGDSAKGAAGLDTAAKLGEVWARHEVNRRNGIDADSEAALDRRFNELLERVDGERDAGNFRAALATYDSALAIRHMGAAFAGRGFIRLRFGDTTGALVDFDSAVAIDAGRVYLARIQRGQLRLALGDKHGARADLDAVDTVDFQRISLAQGFFDRGMLRLALGDKGAGMKDMRKAVYMGWANAQRVLEGKRPVPVESLNVVVDREADSVRAVHATHSRELSASQQSSEHGSSLGVSLPSLTGRSTLDATIWAMTAIVAAMLLAAVIFGLRLTLTPESNVAQFAMASGERQLWIGAPVQGVIVNRPQAHSTVRTVVTTAMIAGVLWYGGVSIDAVIYLGFALIVGAFVTIWRVLSDARRRRITTYALTTNRAIVCVGDNLQSYPLDHLSAAELSENDDGTGTITWGSIKGDLEKQLQVVKAEGRRPSASDLRIAMRSGKGQRRAFERILAAQAVLEKMKSVAPAPAASARAAHAPSPVRVSVTTSSSATATNALRSPSSIRAAFFAVFLLAGLTLGYFVAFPALEETIAARDWVSVPCTILSSRLTRISSVSRNAGGHYTPRVPTYQVNVRYKYTYQGKLHFGDRFQIAPISLGGNIGMHHMEQQLASMLPGSETTCWLDPVHPDNAVMDRGVSLGLALGVGLPGIFVLVGLLGVVGMIKRVLDY